MASSGSGQHSGSSVGAAHTKISPRKFSEKIALLNKKEAEGNAEFEEIIKEVQATRSQSACGFVAGSSSNGNGGPPMSAASFGAVDAGCRSSYSNLENEHSVASRQRERRDELEEVFENLIKCVGQYEQELQEEQQRQQSAAATNVTVASQTFATDDTLDRPASVGLANRYHNSRQQQLTLASIPAANSALPLSNGRLSSNDNNDKDGLNANNNSSNIGQYYAATSNFLGLANSFYAQGAAPMGGGGDPSCAGPATGCRARVTSFGSGSCRYANSGSSSAGRHQQASGGRRANRHHGLAIDRALPGDSRATVCGANTSCVAGAGVSGMFLKPACDRSKQKSCSDPTLHVACVQSISAAANFDNSCSDVLPLAAAPNGGGSDGDARIVRISNDSNNNVSRGILAAANAAAFAAASINRQQQLGRQSLGGGSNSIVHQSRAASYVSNEAASLARAELLAEAVSSTELNGCPPAAAETALSSTSQERLYCDSSVMSLMGDVPGIQICTFDEDNINQQQQAGAAASVRPESRDSSLPDIANLQFSNVPSEKRQQSAIAAPTTAVPTAATPTPTGQQHIEQASYPQQENGFHQNHHQSQQNLDANYQQQQQSEQLCQRQTIAPSQSDSSAGHSHQNSASSELYNSTNTLQATGSADWTCVGDQHGASSNSNISNSSNSNLPLCAPRVSSFLSSSDCGLTWSGSNSSNSDHSHNLLACDSMACPPTINSAGSMFRSHSHNSIDHLTKQRLPQQFQQPQPQQQQQQQMQFHHQQQVQYHHRSSQPHRAETAGVEQRNCAGNSNSNQYIQMYSQQQQGNLNNNKFAVSNLQQQAGSMSPSSNLSSPQSELNSPGVSSSGDYASSEFAGPFSSSANLQKQVNEQQQEPVYLMPHQPGSQQQQQACYTSHSSNNGNNPYHQHQIIAQQQQQQQFGFASETGAMAGGYPLASAGGSSSIGPCTSPSAARRLHNQAARGLTYSPFSPLSRNSNSNGSNTGGGGGGNC